jgi:hypothetical protein
MADTSKLVNNIGLPLVRLLLRLTPQGALLDISEDLARLTRGVGDYLSSRRTERALVDVADIAAEKLSEFIQVEFPTADPGDIAAAITSVGETLTAVGMDTALLIEKELDPIKLSRHMMKVAGRRQRSSLHSEGAERVFDILLEEVCSYLVEIATSQPDFTVKGIASMLERGQSISDKIEEILTRLPARSHEADQSAKAAAFDTQYRRNVANRFDRMDIIGADLERITRRYSLSTAYVSLRSHASLRAEEADPSEYTAREVETVLSSLGKRIVVWGEAGCGKTTLLQWAAVSAARRELPSSLGSWNSLVPFVVRLRKYIKQALPTTEELVTEAGSTLSAIQPEGWCTETALSGRGLILVDGLDEVPDKQRSAVHEWLENLIASFPDNYYIVTSRPAALRSNSAVLDGFQWAWLLPMEPPEIKVFIRSWHEAIAERVGTTEREGLPQLGEQLVGKVLSSRPLRNLASSPLLCAVTCALHYSRLGSLPRRRVRLYEAVLEMLLGRRDEARGLGVSGIGPDEKREVLEDLAEWLIINGQSEASRSQVLLRVRKSVKAMPHVQSSADQVLTELIERSGILREPVPGTIDFLHRTFQEYLASKALVNGGNVSLLVNRSFDSEWQEVIVLAAGHAPPLESREILTRLIEKADVGHHEVKSRLYFLCIACIDAAVRVDPVVADRIRAFVAELIPPRSPDAMSSVAAVGDSAVPLLAETLTADQSIDANALAYSVKALITIGGEEAFAVLAHLHPTTKATVVESLVEGWSYFEPERYATEVLSDIELDNPMTVELRDVERLKYSRLLPEQLLIHCSLPSVPKEPDEVFSAARIHSLWIGPPQGIGRLWLDGATESYDFLTKINGLTSVLLDGVRNFRIFERGSTSDSVAELEVRFEARHGGGHVDCRVFGRFPALAELTIHLRQPGYLEHFEELPLSLTDLRILAPHFVFYRQWPQLSNLRRLELRGYPNQTFASLSRYSRLEEIRIDSQDLQDITGIEQLQNLLVVDVAECEELQNLSPLSKLTSLRKVRLCGCHQPFRTRAKGGVSRSVEIEDKRAGGLMSGEDFDLATLPGEPGDADIDWLAAEFYEELEDFQDRYDLEPEGSDSDDNAKQNPDSE